MGDRMVPLPFGRLLDWMLDEYEQKQTVFGVSALAHHRMEDRKLPIFGELLEAPFGPAAGPHTQLAQNIAAAYAAGGRFFELKTVQTLDGVDLPVSKPCITAQDECYNCEWSTELRVQEAMEEYIKAWLLLKLMAREFRMGDPNGFVFNMSVGYDLEGISSPKIDGFIEGLRDARITPVWDACISEIKARFGRLTRVDWAYVQGLSPHISSSITLSTLHGCPPQEIERIASYLLRDKGLHTFVKCNPTLLGYPYVRETLERLGFDYIDFDDRHFREDLQYADAVPMLERLQALADAFDRSFGVKLTNTLPVHVRAQELPGAEMYMSGRALYPLTIELAARLSRSFEGRLRISYSGGADMHSIEKLFAAGIWPITMATTLLKPGGYNRLHQMAEALHNCGDQPFSGVRINETAFFAGDVFHDPYYQKPVKPTQPHRLAGAPPLLSCFAAPCRSGCPFGQDIPAYLRHVSQGDHLGALRIITERNPLPFTTGTICAHHCTESCMRRYYEEHVHIRSVKLEAAQKAYDQLMRELTTPVPLANAPQVAIVGAGPAGLAAGSLLARAGARVTVLEQRPTAGGIVRHVIPAFRIPDDAIVRDIALAQAYGVQFRFNEQITKLEALFEQGFTHVVLACGAWKPGHLPLEYGEAIGALAFLEAAKKQPETLSLGADVVVIGGGNTAMDAARAAMRLPGARKVRLVYRRDRRNMPADEEELAAARADGVELCELLAPVGVRDGTLTCKRMRLGEPDESGRRAPVDTGALVTLPASCVIAAVGEHPDDAFLKSCNLETDAHGYARFDPKTLQTSRAKVYIAGDAARGPATVAEAIADAAVIARAILSVRLDRYEAENRNPDGGRRALCHRGELYVDFCTHAECDRCLECATVCEICAEVCPNRANLAVEVAGQPTRQIVHVDALCNECGNCAAFCPYEGAPYRDKLTLFSDPQAFEESGNDGFLPLDPLLGRYRVRIGGRDEVYRLSDRALDQPLCELIEATYAQYRHLFTEP